MVQLRWVQLVKHCPLFDRVLDEKQQYRIVDINGASSWCDVPGQKPLFSISGPAPPRTYVDARSVL